jgi:proteic killer suppression protein
MQIYDIYTVKFSKQALKDLQKIPHHIIINLEAWIHAVGLCGLSEVMKIRSYHDELLKGDRAGERSIRLNKAYRAIYIIKNDGCVRFVEIMEVTKHEY